MTTHASRRPTRLFRLSRISIAAMLGLAIALVVPTAAAAAVTADTVDFGHIALNVAVSKQVSIPVTAGQGFYHATPSDPGITVTPGGCAGFSNPGDGKHDTCTFTATASFSRITTIDGMTINVTECNSSCTVATTVIVPLTGGAYPALKSDPDQVDFGDVPLNTPVSKTLTVTIDAGYHYEHLPPVISALTVDDGTCAGFAGPGTCTITLTAKASTPTTLTGVPNDVQECAAGCPFYYQSFVTITGHIGPLLTVSAPTLSHHYGQPLSTADISAVSYSGFQPGDDPHVLGGTLSCTLTDGKGHPATPSDHLPVGTYTIDCSGLTSSTYVIDFKPGAVGQGQAGTTTTLSGPAGPVESGAPATLTVQVASDTGPVVTGAVQVYQGTAGDTSHPVPGCGLTLSGGTANCTVTANGPATSRYWARYPDTTNFDGSSSKNIAVTVLSPPVIITKSLPHGTVGTKYHQTLAVTGGSSKHVWSLVKGALPAGITLSPAGVLSGTPTKAGTSGFTVSVDDPATAALTLVVDPAPVTAGGPSAASASTPTTSSATSQTSSGSAGSSSSNPTGSAGPPPPSSSVATPTSTSTAPTNGTSTVLPTSSASGALSSTGFPTVSVLLAALALLVVGVTLALVGRRRRRTH